MVQRGSALRIVGRGLPVFMKRSTPDAKIEDLHDDVSHQDVHGGAFDHQGLLQVLGDSPVKK